MYTHTITLFDNWIDILGILLTKYFVKILSFRHAYQIIWEGLACDLADIRVIGLRFLEQSVMMFTPFVSMMNIKFINQAYRLPKWWEYHYSQAKFSY